VIAADLSLKSLAHVVRLAHATGKRGRILAVVADVTALPFADHTFASVTSAETLEHVPDHRRAVEELARVLGTDGWLVGSVPAVPSQWSEWDEWAGHLRRYSRTELENMLRAAGLEATVTIWGWPLLRVYDEFFLKRVNRRRLRTDGAVECDRTLRRISRLGRRRALVAFVRAFFEIDRLFDGARWGVGLLFAARKLR
jgi:SAM-dependent methyltransferase